MGDKADEVNYSQQCLTAITNLDKKMSAKLTVLEEKMAATNEEITEIKTSQQFISDTFDGFRQDMDHAKEDIKSLQMENTALKTTVKNLEQKLAVNSDETDKMDQYLRRDCLELAGIPVIPNEDTNAIVCAVAKNMGVELDDCDISTSHRLPPPRRGKGTPRIIVKFVRRDKKEEFYNNRKKAGDTAELQCAAYSSNRIYVNEALTPKRKVLFFKCKQVKSEKNYDYLWTKNGKIFMRANEISEIQEIRNESDLNKL